MNKQKILLLTDIISPYRIPVFNLLAQDPSLEFSVLSLTKDMAGREWQFEPARIKFKYRILNSIQYRLPLSDRPPCVVSRGLKRAIQEINPELIIITGYYQPDYLRTILYSRRKNFKIICWVESHPDSLRIKNFLSHGYRKWFINSCSAFIVPGERSRGLLLALNVPEKAIFTAPNAVDNNYYYVNLNTKYEDKKKMPGFEKYPARNFLYAGRLLKNKGVETLVRAYAQARLGKNVGLIIVGSGNSQSYLQTLSGKLKLSNIFFAGFKQSAELKNFYRFADLFVFPSLRDEWAMVLNEAAIAGLPIITTREPAAADTLVTPENGWYFKKNDVSGLADCLKNILLPEKELLKKARQSQDKAKAHSPENCARSIIKAVKETLAKKRIAVSSAGVLHSHSLAKALDNLAILSKLFTPSRPRRENSLGPNYVQRLSYPHLLLRPLIAAARKYRNLTNIFVNSNCILFDKRVSVRIKKTTFDLFHGFSGSCLYSMLQAKEQGIVCLVDQHDVYYKVSEQVFAEEVRGAPSSLSTISNWPPHRGYHQRVDRELEIADYILVPSSFALKTFLDNGIPEEKLVLMPLGINAGLLQGTRSVKQNKVFKVGFVGSIGLRKGIKYLLNAVREIDNPDIQLYIAGSLTARGDILQKYKGYYKLTGFIESGKVTDFICGLDVLVLPSLIDSFGLVILEAMACSVPVIASENTAGPDIIANGKEGFIVPIRDATAIKEKILFLYNNSEIKNAMGKRAFNKAANFTWARYAQRYQDFIENITRNR